MLPVFVTPWPQPPLFDAQCQRAWVGAAAVAMAAVLAGCASPTHRAPVEERKPVPRAAPVAPAPSSAQPAAAPKPVAAPTPSAAELAASRLQLPGWENAGKPGYYTVKPGDTLIRISLDNGQNWRDVARWSGLDNPNIIEVGQVLRIAPPSAALPATASPAVASSRPLGASGTVETRPLDGTAVTGAVSPAGGSVTATTAATTAVTTAGTTAGTPSVAPSSATAAPASATASPPVVAGAAPAAAPSAPQPAREGDDEVNWAWPASGPVAMGFDEVKSKGLAITGRAGDPVLAAADGRVVYSGSGLRGYGNLIIVKHNATYLTAYAHNQTLLVKEDQAVRRGQKIAEMGSSDADRVQLHFEVRRQGKPIDPARLLPPR